MMKTIFALTAAAVVIVSTPAMAGTAGTITAEARFADVRNGATDSAEYDVQYNAPLNSFLTYGAEIQVKQAAHAGALDSKISAKVGPALPDVLGFHTLAYAEVGQALKQGDDYTFWGAGAKASRTVYGPVSATIGYRHREAFEATRRLDEDRLEGGLGYDIGSGNTVGVKYYRTSGTTRSDAVAVALNHSF